MSRLALVRIRFCGGCNPEIDRGETAQQVITLLKERMNTTFDPNIPADLTLHVCGCAHACLDEENPADDPEQVVSIQGLRVDLEPVSEGELADATVNKIRQALRKAAYITKII
ncbi:MAG: hypothetical protein K9K82_02970 [Desulfobacteraceae bacterium]|nr:hypothetical protein [Desulfobacteraceae bacterium]